MEKIIDLNGRKIGVKASALIPRIYRSKTNRDLFVDVTTLQDLIKDNKIQSSEALEIIEDLAYSMAYNYDNSIGTIDEWLGTFETINDLYNIIPSILNVWIESNKTTSKP